MLHPADLEIVRNRLDMITSEAGTALIRSSSSLVIAEAKDFGFTITDAQGQPLTVPPLWIGRLGLSVGSLIQSTLAQGVAVADGDQVLCNDPHLGALHVLDVGVFAPVFVEGELIAWVGSAAHHQDVGGLVSGWSVGATQAFQEGIVFPPTRLVVGGELDEQVLSIYLANVRYPDRQVFDLRAQVSANLVAKERLLALIDSIGVPTFKEAMVGLRGAAEDSARAAVAQIPDGVYSVVDYLDHDVAEDRLYKISCDLTVSSDELIFDFSGAADEAPGFVNCTRACTVSTVQNVVLGLLVPFDIKNSGSFENVVVETRPNSIVACGREAASSGSTAEAGYRVQDVALSVLSKALAASRDPEAAVRATAVWGGSFTAPQFAFKWRDARTSGMLCMDATGMGGGARQGRDGLDSASNALSIGLTMPNVESYEEEFPLLYVQRRLSTDTGGAGTWRGGAGLRFSLLLDETEDCDATLTLLSSRRHPPPPGLFGGYPGGSSWFRLYGRPEAEGAIRSGGLSLEGEEAKVLPQKVRGLELGQGQILDAQCPGGGGLGDPLLRAPERVRDDVEAGIVSREAARALYGVVLRESGDETAVDLAATEELRERGFKGRMRGRLRIAPEGGVE